ncbi:hypothetical protein ACFFMN_24435 [Planobispora siamensis]|uniref:ATP-grasp domain-containing protein n=1 Tax=Planobispora siamensis TaxID=936338 RepID=A0A8J3SHY5_9ACTN|nr:hypothetical protein [Planobispora siamensis]GIH94841.1 hypothetical protein Psi01_54710 [Planobispora siamensis]
MRNDRILMVMPDRRHVRKAVAEGLRVYAIWDPALKGRDHLEDVARDAEQLVLTDFTDVAALRTLVFTTAVRRDVAHILHLGWHDTQLAVCEEARVLGMSPHPPGCLLLINDRRRMRRLLSEAGLPFVTSVEEFLRGPVLTVQTLTVDGRHHVVDIRPKAVISPFRLPETGGRSMREGPVGPGEPDGPEDAGHLYPTWLPASARTETVKLVTAFLDATGYRFGPTRTEVILGDAGPLVVEAQTRQAEERVLSLIEAATGVDVEAAMFRALAGGPLPFPLPDRAAPAAVPAPSPPASPPPASPPLASSAPASPAPAPFAAPAGFPAPSAALSGPRVYTG